MGNDNGSEQSAVFATRPSRMEKNMEYSMNFFFQRADLAQKISGFVMMMFGIRTEILFSISFAV